MRGPDRGPPRPGAGSALDLFSLPTRSVHLAYLVHLRPACKLRGRPMVSAGLAWATVGLLLLAAASAAAQKKR